MQLRTNSVVVLTLIVNLVLGNCILLLTDKAGGWTLGMLCLSAASVTLLLAGFRVIKAHWSWWQLILWGILCTAAIPFTGMFFVGLFMSVSEGIVNALGKALVAAILFGVVGASIFTIPFHCFNIAAFFMHRTFLRRDGQQ